MVKHAAPATHDFSKLTLDLGLDPTIFTRGEGVWPQQCGSDAEFAANEFASGESTSTNEGPVGHVVGVNDGEGGASEQKPGE